MRIRIFSLMLCVCLLFTSMIPVMASAEEATVQPRLTYIQTATVMLSPVDDDTLNVYCSMDADNSTVTNCYIKYTVQKKGFLGLSWSDKISGSLSTGTYYATVSRNITGFSSGTYRLKVELTAKTSSGQSETITVYSSEQKL
ncbi:MAG: hypothetical protein J6A50_05170 [Clostridia bacterium]|nr:hypothetical protein [Clostridia bacterium]